MSPVSLIRKGSASRTKRKPLRVEIRSWVLHRHEPQYALVWNFDRSLFAHMHLFDTMYRNTCPWRSGVTILVVIDVCMLHQRVWTVYVPILLYDYAIIIILEKNQCCCLLCRISLSVISDCIIHVYTCIYIIFEYLYAYIYIYICKYLMHDDHGEHMTIIDFSKLHSHVTNN